MSGDVTSSIQQFISSDTDEWATPPQFVRPLADAVGGFDLDPASGAEQSPIADETYTEADDGLTQPWFGTVWVNPPYSEMAAWTRKAINESNRSATDTIIYLCKGDSSADWWQRAVRESSAVAMIDHRLSFGDGGDAPFPSHVFVFGDVADDVLHVLARRGAVFRAPERVTRTTQQGLATDGSGDYSGGDAA